MVNQGGFVLTWVVNQGGFVSGVHLCTTKPQIKDHPMRYHPSFKITCFYTLVFKAKSSGLNTELGRQKRKEKKKENDVKTGVVSDEIVIFH